MKSFLRNATSKLYNVVSAPVVATRDVLTERLQSVPETASLLYNRLVENMGYRQDTLKDIVEKEAEEEGQPTAAKEKEEQQQESAAAQEQQQDDDDYELYDTVTKIKLVREGKRVKVFRVTGNLNRPNTKMIMANTYHTLR